MRIVFVAVIQLHLSGYVSFVNEYPFTNDSTHIMLCVVLYPTKVVICMIDLYHFILECVTIVGFVWPYSIQQFAG